MSERIENTSRNWTDFKTFEQYDDVHTAYSALVHRVMTDDKTLYLMEHAMSNTFILVEDLLDAAHALRLHMETLKLTLHDYEVTQYAKDLFGAQTTSIHDSLLYYRKLNAYMVLDAALTRYNDLCDSQLHEDRDSAYHDIEQKLACRAIRDVFLVEQEDENEAFVATELQDVYSYLEDERVNAAVSYEYLTENYTITRFRWAPHPDKLSAVVVKETSVPETVTNLSTRFTL